MVSARKQVDAASLDESNVRSGPPATDSGALVRHLPDLRRRAGAMLRRPVDAEDLAQDCLLRALPHLRDIENPRAYLFQTLRNAYADRLSLQSREGAILTLDEAAAELIVECSPDLQLELRDLRRNLAKLPRGQRQVVLLVAAAGATYDEAAARLNLPVGTVMSRLSRARRALRDASRAENG
jgi:RNA polymerase sigma-70 factor (ECF subfamily)